MSFRITTHNEAFEPREFGDLFWCQVGFGSCQLIFQSFGISTWHTGLHERGLCSDAVAGAQDEFPSGAITLQQCSATHLSLSPIGDRVVA